MHSVSFVFDGNGFTITLHRRHLARAVPGVPFDWARAAYSIDVVTPQVCNLHSQQGVAPDFVSHQWSCGAEVLWSLEPASGTRFPCGMHGESASTVQLARRLPF